jgi:hypothetical protein
MELYLKRCNHYEGKRHKPAPHTYAIIFQGLPEHEVITVNIPRAVLIRSKKVLPQAVQQGKGGLQPQQKGKCPLTT